MKHPQLRHQPACDPVVQVHALVKNPIRRTLNTTSGHDGKSAFAEISVGHLRTLMYLFRMQARSFVFKMQAYKLVVFVNHGGAQICFQNSGGQNF